jgi:hypothetical protein
MATFFFRVYESAAEVAHGDPIQEDTVTIGVTHELSAVIPAKGPTDTQKRHRRVRIFADVDCFVTWGDNPEATGDGQSGMPLGAENPEYISILSGQRFSVIQR